MMKKKPYIFKKSAAIQKSDPMGHDEFWQMLDKSEAEVKKWPAWKRKVNVEFWTPECMACEMASSFLADMAKGYAGKIVVVKVNTQRCPEAVKKYTIDCWPTFILFKGGRIAVREHGFRKGLELEKKIRLNLN
jgi:thiol-disulfide isomerase/thioredoxin